MHDDVDLDDEPTRVRRWRKDNLVAAGFSEFTAFRIAVRLDVPKERAIELLERGMSEQQVADELIED